MSFDCKDTSSSQFSYLTAGLTFAGLFGVIFFQQVQPLSRCVSGQIVLNNNSPFFKKFTIIIGAKIFEFIKLRLPRTQSNCYRFIHNKRFIIHYFSGFLLIMNSIKEMPPV